VRHTRMLKTLAHRNQCRRSPARSFTRLQSKPRSLARRLACPFDTGSRKKTTPELTGVA
jgi:hypothetical protein